MEEMRVYKVNCLPLLELSEVDGVADVEEGDFLAWQQYSVNFMKRSFPEHLSSGPSAVKAVTFLDPEYQNFILVFL